MRLSWIGILMPFLWLFCGLYLLEDDSQELVGGQSKILWLVGICAALGTFGFIAGWLDLRANRFREAYGSLPVVTMGLNIPAVLTFALLIIMALVQMFR